MVSSNLSLQKSSWPQPMLTLVSFILPSCALWGWWTSLCCGQNTPLVYILRFFQKKAFRACLCWWVFLLCSHDLSPHLDPQQPRDFFFTQTHHLLLTTIRSSSCNSVMAQVCLSYPSLSHCPIFPSPPSSLWNFLPILESLCHVHSLACWNHP